MQENQAKKTLFAHCVRTQKTEIKNLSNMKTCIFIFPHFVIS